MQAAKDGNECIKATGRADRRVDAGRGAGACEYTEAQAVHGWLQVMSRKAVPKLDHHPHVQQDYKVNKLRATTTAAGPLAPYDLTRLLPTTTRECNRPGVQPAICTTP